MISLVPLTQVAPPDGVAAPWWTVVAGVIAIPTAVLGIFYTISLMKKTRLETRKFELEVKEKEASISAIGQGESTEAATLTRLVAQPLIEGRRVQEIILRFIILFLVLEAWRIIERIFEALASGILLGFNALLRNTDSSWWEVGVGIIFLLIKETPTVGYYLVLIGLGGPIFMDSMRYIGISPPKLLTKFERPTRRTYVLLGIVVLIVSIFASFT